MPLSVATIKSTIVSKLDAQYGAPANAAEQEKFATAIAEALFDVLTVQATVASNGATGAGSPGGPLPIVALPGLIS